MSLAEPPQRTDEWDHLDASALKYHTQQWDTPKRSTVAFETFLQARLVDSTRVLDLGAGAGAATAYFASRHSVVGFYGLDLSAELVGISNNLVKKFSLSNLHFQQGDWYSLRPKEQFDGVMSLQTLSWLPDYKSPLQQIFTALKPRWIGLTSLFYEGDITCRIEVEEHTRGRKTFYNIYSLPAIARLCAEEGYSLTAAVPFKIDIDVEKPADSDVMGTYTQRLATDAPGEIKRIQISGPLLMSWHMLLIERL